MKRRTIATPGPPNFPRSTMLTCDAADKSDARAGAIDYICDCPTRATVA